MKEINQVLDQYT